MVNEQGGGTGCPHHMYVTESQRITEERLRALESNQASMDMLINCLCDKIDAFIVEVHGLVKIMQDKSLTQEDDISNLELALGVTTVEIKNNKDTIKEMRGWIMGFVSALLTAGLAYLVYLMQHVYK